MAKPRLWAVILAALCLGLSFGDDSLRGALEAINRRQRDLSDSTLYYLEHFRPQERTMYPRRGEGDGQLEDIGYGYQKTLAPKTSGVFEAIPLPESELGSHSPGVETHKNLDTFDDKALEDIAMNIIQHYKTNNLEGGEPQHYINHHHNPDMKRSVFRERDINDLPDTLQNLSPDSENPQQFFENGEHQHTAPSLFRERYTPKPFRKHSARNAQTLVRNFGGLNRDEDNFPSGDDDSDEYLSMLNSVWEKYQDSNPEALDPEDLSESDVEEIMDYLNHKVERKRQPENSYQTGYDFVNSPLAWVKRDRQRLTDDSTPSGDQFLHALKFLNSHTDTLESMQEDDVPDEERDEDVARLLLEEQAQNTNKRYKKRFWRGNTYEEHNRIAKRYPITKRSSSYYTSPAALYHKASNEKFRQRRKKNAKGHPVEGSTDPKVAQEINDIFSRSDNSTKEKSSDKLTDKAKVNRNSSNSSSTDQITHTKNDTKSFGENPPDHQGAHIKRKRSGQKEETSFESQHKPLDISKKAVRWSDYFGIDRRKKSLSKPSNDEWLLDQYLKAYSISARAIQDSDDQSGDFNTEDDQKGVDDMDAKLRAMEDMIVDQALKYTGAHEGMTDSEEVQAVKDRVIAQLAAAYSLEKMRKALSEFKSSMAAQKASTHTTTNAPTDVPEQKDKRVAVKKEKAGLPPDPKLEKKDSDNEIGVLQSPEHQHQPAWAQEESCPIMDDISVRCREIANMAGDVGQTLSPLCNLHQVCYLCGAETGTAASGCDLTFLSEANGLCGDSPRCRYTVRRTMAAMRTLRGDPSRLGCDWQRHPCLARYLSVTVR